MKRSNVKKRLDRNDTDTLAVIKRVDEIEAWRDKFEVRFNDLRQQI